MKRLGILALAVSIVSGVTAQAQTAGATGGATTGSTGGTTGSSSSSSSSTGLTSAINTSVSTLSSPPSLSAGLIGNQSTISAVNTGGPATSTGSNSVSSGVSTANVFYSTFNNPISGGITVAAAGGGQFGAPAFSTASTQQTTLATSNTVNVSIVGSSLSGTNGGGTVNFGGTGATNLAPITQYVADYPMTQTPATRLQAQVRQVLGRSTALAGARNINVGVAGDNTVLLRGTVGGDRERRLAEGLVWLTPGVSRVQNELRVP